MQASFINIAGLVFSLLLGSTAVWSIFSKKSHNNILMFFTLAMMIVALIAIFSSIILAIFLAFLYISISTIFFFFNTESHAQTKPSWLILNPLAFFTILYFVAKSKPTIPTALNENCNLFETALFIVPFFLLTLAGISMLTSKDRS